MKEVDFDYVTNLPAHLRRLVAFYEYARASVPACNLVAALQKLAFGRPPDFSEFKRLVRQNSRLATPELMWLVPMTQFPNQPIKNIIHCYRTSGDSALRWFGVTAPLGCIGWKVFADIRKTGSDPQHACETWPSWNSCANGDVFAIKIPIRRRCQSTANEVRVHSSVKKVLNPRLGLAFMGPLVFARVLSLIPTVLLFASCAQDVANRYYAAERYPPRDPRSVELLSHAPSRPFEVIADFQSRGESSKTFQKRAAEIGADAVIVTRVGGQYPRRQEWAGAEYNDESNTRNSNGHLIGSAIRYKQ